MLHFYNLPVEIESEMSQNKDYPDYSTMTIPFNR